MLLVKEPSASRILKYGLYTTFMLGVVCIATLPFMLDTYGHILRGTDQLEPGYRSFILTFLISVGVPGLWIVFEMILMLHSIPKGPFVMRNVLALNRIGVIFLALAAAFFGKCLLYITFLALLCGFIFIGGSLFAFTLAALIRQAVVFREENDLTI
jgi:hypothetical protein